MMALETSGMMYDIICLDILNVNCRLVKESSVKVQSTTNMQLIGLLVVEIIAAQ